MGDLWIVRREEDGEILYLLEHEPFEVWVQKPRDAATFSNARARAIAGNLGLGRDVRAVRRFEETRKAFLERGVPQ